MQMTKTGMMLALSLSLSLTASPELPAQCTGNPFPDGLVALTPTQCCSPGNPPILPTFPNTHTTPGIWFSSTNCLPPVQVTVTVVIGAPRLQLCTTFLIPITVTSASGTPALSGNLMATYVGTWIEQRIVNGFMGQVWRFLISGDVTFTTGTPDVPPNDQDPPPTVHLVGSIDYACVDNGAGVPLFAIRYDLHHLCDCFEHASGGPRPAPPGGFHPNTDFHLVGPVPVTLTIAPIPFPNPCGTQNYLNGSLREFDPVANTCFLATPLVQSTGMGGPMRNIEICNNTPPTLTCGCGGPGSLWQIPQFFSLRDGCNSNGVTLVIQGGNPCTQTSGVMERFVVRHGNPPSGTIGIFPAGRDVFFWFIRGDLSGFNGGLCNGNVLSTTGKETLTGVTTKYLPGSPFRAFDFYDPTMPPVALIRGQSTWMNHHQLADNQQSHLPIYGVPTIGTFLLVGLN